jgi:hypothetical protein
MDAKSVVLMEVKRNDNVYQFLMPAGVTYGEACDVAFELAANIAELSKKIAEQARQANQEALDKKDA